MRQQQWQGPQQRPEFPPRFFWIVLLLASMFAATYFWLLPFLGINVGGRSGNNIDPAPYAVKIAQSAYQWRATHVRTGHNFGGALIVVKYRDGTLQQYPLNDRNIIIYEGEDLPNDLDPNRLHSERQTDREFIRPLLQKFRSTNGFDNAIEIQVIIFSQYPLCPSCVSDMRSWQDEYCKIAGFPNLYLSGWQLTKTFYPNSQDKRRREQPVVNGEEDIEMVNLTPKSR